MYKTLGSVLPAVPYKMPGGVLSVSDEIGLNLPFDDVDGICALDPGSALNPSPVGMQYLSGDRPQQLPTTLPNQLEVSVFRDYDPISQQHYAASWMTGWPQPGLPTSAPSLAISTIAFSPSGPFLVLNPFVRSALTMQFGGHPEHDQVAIPQTHVMSNAPVYFFWVALDQMGNLDLSHPVELIL
jgi:hypothetical protein